MAYGSSVPFCRDGIQPHLCLLRVRSYTAVGICKTKGERKVGEGSEGRAGRYREFRERSERRNSKYSSIGRSREQAKVRRGLHIAVGDVVRRHRLCRRDGMRVIDRFGLCQLGASKGLNFYRSRQLAGYVDCGAIALHALRKSLHHMPRPTYNLQRTHRLHELTLKRVES